jgi:hypothetical protein
MCVINPIVNPNPVWYSRRTRDNILQRRFVMQIEQIFTSEIMVRFMRWKLSNLYENLSKDVKRIYRCKRFVFNGRYNIKIIK